MTGAIGRSSWAGISALASTPDSPRRNSATEARRTRRARTRPLDWLDQQRGEAARVACEAPEMNRARWQRRLISDALHAKHFGRFAAGRSSQQQDSGQSNLWNLWNLWMPSSAIS